MITASCNITHTNSINLVLLYIYIYIYILVLYRLGRANEQAHLIIFIYWFNRTLIAICKQVDSEYCCLLSKTTETNIY